MQNLVKKILRSNLFQQLAVDSIPDFPDAGQVHVVDQLTDDGTDRRKLLSRFPAVVGAGASDGNRPPHAIMTANPGEQSVVRDRKRAAAQKADKQFGRPQAISWFAQ